MQRHIAVTLLAGFLAGSLPFLSGVGPLFSVITSLAPLFLVGFSYGSAAGMKAGALATVTAFLVGGEQAAFSLAIFMVLPANIMLKRLLSYTTDAQGKRVWYPALRVLTEVTALAAVYCYAYALMLGSNNPVSLSDMVRNSFTVDTTAFDARTTTLVQTIINEWGFIVFAFGAWLWLVILWLIAYGCHRMLAVRGKALRPDITFAPRGLPGWLLGLLALFIGLATFGAGNDAFVGKAVVLVLLIPYLISGMAMIHIQAYYWQPRTLWLSLIYIILFFFAALTIIVAGAGIYYHLVEMLDKRKKIG